MYFFDIKNKNGYKFYNKKAELIANDEKSLIYILKSVEKYTTEGFFVAGFISYEAGCYLVDKPIKHKELSMPLLHFVVFEKMDQISYIKSQNNTHIYDIKYNETEKEYIDKVLQLKAHIKNGDTYQTNYTFQFNFKATENAEKLFYDLCNKQNSEFAAFLDFDNYSIISLSPELFLKKENSRLTSKPMKGSWKIGQNYDDKIISENSIIVDLIRNDMSVIAQKSSVKVVNPFEVQNFDTINQMISTVECTVDKNKTFYDIIKAMFPCGSITGAPKIRTMEIISNLENSARQVYCGSIGFIMPNNDFCFNVAIRTAVLEKKTNKYTMGIGGGVIYGSKDTDEFSECILKSEFLRSLNDFEIFETMKSVDGDIENLDLHIKRLQNSAKYFGFNYNNIVLPKIENGNKKVKICLKQNGEYTIKVSEIEQILTNKIKISHITMNHKDIFLQHKTTKREIYTKEYKKYSLENFYDVVFVNDLGFISEASRNNIFIKCNNLWFTPPILSGILPGITRDIFIKQNNVIEKNITVQDIQNADEIWLSNSIRGLVKVVL